ncbi:hypothetical protein GOBAR_DD31443 [Gossypium barbadense]|nr:hypothetical protein GOBAR_DD31443 [Gossypium barbadense]
MSSLTKPKQKSSSGCRKWKSPQEVVAVEGPMERRWKMEEPYIVNKQSFTLIDELETPHLQNRVKKLARNNLRNGMTGKGRSGRAERSIHNVNSSLSLTRAGAEKCSSYGCNKCKCNLQSDLNKTAAYREGMAMGSPNKKKQNMDAYTIHQYYALLDERKKYPIAGKLFNL